MKIIITLIGLVLILSSFIAGYRFRGWCDDEEIDLKYRLRWLSPRYLRITARIRWATFKETYWAWRNKLDKLPGGSLVVTSLSIGPYGEQIVGGDLPADIFHPLQVGMMLELPATEPGMQVSIKFRNRSDYTFEVDCAFRAKAFDRTMYMIQIPRFESKTNSQYEYRFTSEKLCRIDQLMIQLPRYVKKPGKDGNQKEA